MGNEGRGAEGLISVVIVNWNTRDLLLGCIESLAADCSDGRCEIIVVDNASVDGSAEAVRERFPEVIMIASETNDGFAHGCNLGARRAGGDYILLLNPDTRVPSGTLHTLRRFLEEHEEVGVVGPKLVGTDGERQVSSFGMFPSVAEAVAHATHIWTLRPQSSLARRFLCTPAPGSEWCYAAHLLGACLLVRREVYENLGGLDAGYFLFLEETDFCYRAALAGWRCAYLESAAVVHYGEQSVVQTLTMSGGLYIRSYNRFCRKFGMSLPRRLLINAALISGVLISALACLVKRRDIPRAGRILRTLRYGYLVRPRI